MVIRDRVALGVLAGVVGAIPQVILNLISRAVGFSKTYSFALAGGIFLKGKVTEEPGGILLGILLWLFTSAFVGLLIVLFFQKTGKDYWLLKGPLVTIIVMQLFIYGFAFNMANTKVIPVDVSTNISIFFENLVFGVVAGYLVARWSDLPAQ